MNVKLNVFFDNEVGWMWPTFQENIFRDGFYTCSHLSEKHRPLLWFQQEQVSFEKISVTYYWTIL